MEERDSNHQMMPPNLTSVSGRRCWVRFLRTRRLLACISLSTMLCGCVSVKQPTSERLERSRGLWTLLPESDATPADFSKTVFQGQLDSKSRNELAILVGRVQGVNHEPFRVVSWPDDWPIAVKIYVVGNILYCVRTSNGHWELITVAKVNV